MTAVDVVRKLFNVAAHCFMSADNNLRAGSLPAMCEPHPGLLNVAAPQLSRSLVMHQLDYNLRQTVVQFGERPSSVLEGGCLSDIWVLVYVLLASNHFLLLYLLGVIPAVKWSPVTGPTESDVHGEETLPHGVGKSRKCP